MATMISQLAPQQKAKDIFTIFPIILDRLLAGVKSLFEISILLNRVNTGLSTIGTAIKINSRLYFHLQ